MENTLSVKSNTVRRLICILAFAAAFIAAQFALAQPAHAISPDYYSDHKFMDSRDFGASRTLTGNIQLLLVFVNTDEGSWSSSERDEFIAATHDDAAHLESSAADWGSYLDLSVAYFEATVPSEHTEDWYNYLMDNYFYNHDHDTETLQEYYEEKGGFDDAPIMFVFNTEGRSYCYMGRRSNGFRSEYPVYFAKSMRPALSITHELLHMYGANDLYRDDNIKAAAEWYFPDSSMLTGGREVDDLSAFLIGWTDELTQDAADFLEETY